MAPAADAPVLSRGQAELTLAVIAAGYVVLQLVLVPMDRFWAWDEAVYLSQVSDVGQPGWVMYRPEQAR